MKRVAVIGAGWAGLSAAVRAVEMGHEVHVFEMSRQAGGRARSALDGPEERDNGQHILIGAYTETLALMRRVGVAPEQVLRRSPLALIFPDQTGLQLRQGAAVPAFVRAVLGAAHWPWRDRLALLGTALRWRLSGFQCAESATVEDLCARLPASVRSDLVEPLCVAALNTPMSRASGRVFLRVLQDALFAGPGAADLLLPRAPLAQLLPTPAASWLEAQGAELHWAHRVQRLKRDSGHWMVDDQPFDAVVLASTAREAARLVEDIAPSWSQNASSFSYEPIVTVWMLAPGLKWRHPMMALRCSATAPAQFAFDLGALGGQPGCFTFVVSGASAWQAQGLDAVAAAVRTQARSDFPGHFLDDACVVDARAERRATFACTPGLKRPAAHIAPGLAAAGDHVQGPYPATLEGAVRSGAAALDLATRS